jgi:hypothetical protein
LLCDLQFGVEILLLLFQGHEFPERCHVHAARPFC